MCNWDGDEILVELDARGKEGERQEGVVDKGNSLEDYAIKRRAENWREANSSRGSRKAFCFVL